jgi:hypothetical protein
MKFNGFLAPNKPVLDTMETIENRDAVLDLTDPANPKEPAWPDAEFLIGNPPFLGGNKVRAELGDAYVEALFKVYAGRLPSFSDLVCYWFEKARAKVEAGTVKRAGLVATQGIRGGVNRKVLDRIKETGDIYFGVSDRNWELDGATVHISLVGFDDGSEKTRSLDKNIVNSINSDLTSGTDTTTANCLDVNLDIWCYGSQQKAKFDISTDVAVQMLQEPNAWGMPNSDVIRISLGARQMTQRTGDTYVIDFGQELSQEVVSRYELPFEWVKTTIFHTREAHSELRQRNFWWLHARPSPRYRQALSAINRYIVVMGTGKNRIFVWQDTSVLVDHSLIVFLRDDDYFLGVLHSRIHNCWTWRTATQVRERESGLRYTPTTCFETFPFPEPTDAQREAVAAAAKELDGLRSNWLNPPEWTATETLTFPGSVGGPWRRYVTEPDARGVGTVRYPRTVPKSPEHAAKLKDRTLTKLYNQSPAWLTNAHAKLDAAVCTAYGWPATLADDDLLAKLLALNLSRAGSAATAANDDE